MTGGVRTSRAILLTGMSGTGKSSALAELARRGHRTVDTDYGGWITDGPDGEPVWDAARMGAFLDDAREQPAGHPAKALYVAGTVVNQGVFYPRFDAVVLMSAPLDVILARVATRTNNPYGNSAAERDRIAADLAAYEPLLRRTCTVEIDTSGPLAEVVRRLEELAAPRPGEV